MNFLRILAALNALSLTITLLRPDIVAQKTMLAQPTSAAVQTSLAEGLELLRGGQAQQAKIKFDAALKTAPQSADAYTWRGIAENQLGQYPAAAKDFQAALRIHPSLLSAHYNLALSYIRLHRIDPAIEQLRTVITAQPAAVQPRYNLAVLLEGKGSFAEAIAALDPAHAADPTDKGVTLHLLTDNLSLNRTVQLPPLVSEIATPSTSQELQQQAATALIEAARFTDALTILKSARAQPDTPRTKSLLARAYIGDRSYTEAISLLEATPAAERDAGEIYLLALAYTGIGDPLKAVESFEAAAQLDPKDGRPLYHLGLLAAASADGQTKSVPLLRAALRLDPENSVYALALARVLLISDQAEEAKTVLLRIAPTPDTRAQIDALRGVAGAATHSIDEAIPLLRRSLEDDPRLALADNVLGFCLFQKGQYADAAAVYGRAATLEPKRLLYARDAALAYERANQTEQALHFAEQAVAQGQADASSHLLLGKLYAGANRRSDAIRELRRAAELNPDLDAACYLLARTYMQMGDRTQANEWNDKLTSLKQRHDAAVTLQKNPAAAVRSSTLLQGGTLSSDNAGAP